MQDVVNGFGLLFLGSRLKRLGERLQGEAHAVVQAAGLPNQPSQYPILAALERYGAMTVGDLGQATGVTQPAITRSLANLAELGLVENCDAGPDRRQRTVDLTTAGRTLMAKSRNEVWPYVEAAVAEVAPDVRRTLLEHVAAIENALVALPLDRRAAAAKSSGLAIIEYGDDLARAFHDINAEWIEQMFHLEETDRDVLLHPRERIVDAGGTILFVRAEGLGIVGACALLKSGDGAYELTKMGVLEKARGRKAGEFLLRAIIRRANALGARRLYLLTNTKCASAIHLYEKLGFVHDADIMREFGARYERCDVAMLYDPARAPELARESIVGR